MTKPILGRSVFLRQSNFTIAQRKKSNTVRFAACCRIDMPQYSAPTPIRKRDLAVHSVFPDRESYRNLAFSRSLLCVLMPVARNGRGSMVKDAAGPVTLADEGKFAIAPPFVWHSFAQVRRKSCGATCCSPTLSQHPLTTYQNALQAFAEHVIRPLPSSVWADSLSGVQGRGTSSRSIWTCSGPHATRCDRLVRLGWHPD